VAATASSSRPGGTGLIVEGAGTSECTCLYATDMAVSPAYGGAPVSISKSMIPAA
jgi:hypothetical protein